jgi:hypothetical protein
MSISFTVPWHWISKVYTVDSALRYFQKRNDLLDGLDGLEYMVEA